MAQTDKQAQLSGGLAVGGPQADAFALLTWGQFVAQAALAATLSPIIGPSGSSVTLTTTDHFGASQGASTITYSTPAGPVAMAVTSWADQSITATVPLDGLTGGQIVITVPASSKVFLATTTYRVTYTLASTDGATVLDLRDMVAGDNYDSSRLAPVAMAALRDVDGAISIHRNRYTVDGKPIRFTCWLRKDSAAAAALKAFLATNAGTYLWNDGRGHYLVQFASGGGWGELSESNHATGGGYYRVSLAMIVRGFWFRAGDGSIPAYGGVARP